jgi:hypothetical protein
MWGSPSNIEQNLLKRQPYNGFVKKLAKHVLGWTILNVDVIPSGMINDQ